MHPRYAMRPTACIEQHLAERRARDAPCCCRKIGVAMCTNGSGTNSVNPPVSFCSVAGAHEVAGDVDRPFDVAEHDRDVRAQPDLVRDAVRLEPLLGVDLVGADDRPDLVVEDLGRGARQRREPGVLRAARGSRASGMPSRRAPSVTSSAVKPCTWMLRRDLLHGPGDVEVVVAVEVGVDAALQADLGRAAVDRLDARGAGSPRARAGTASPRRFSESGPFENAQNRHLNVQTFV